MAVINKKNVRRVMRGLVADEMIEANSAYGCYGPELADAGRARNKAIARFIDEVLKNTPHDRLLATATFCKIAKHQIAVDVAMEEDDYP